MTYQWGTYEPYGFNHMYDENLIWLCSSDYQNTKFNNSYLPKYYPDKKHCDRCSRKSFDLGIKATIPAIPKTTCANVLHINRRIFI